MPEKMGKDGFIVLAAISTVESNIEVFSPVRTVPFL